MASKTTISCDIRKCDAKDNPVTQGVKLQVIFTTDQTEGRSTSPYLTFATVDICGKCMSRVLQGEAIFAEGAQGYNEYYFKNKLWDSWI